PVWVTRHRPSASTLADKGLNHGWVGHNTYYIRMLGTDITPLYDMLVSLVEERKEHQHAKPDVVIHNGAEGYWEDRNVQRPRKLESVILPSGQMEALVDDIDFFFSTQDWYDDL